MITQSTIISAIHSLGVHPGDTLLVHSSYKSFAAPVEGGPAGVASSLVAAVGRTGTVFVPTFNFAQLPWNPATTPSLTGAITEAFRQLPNAHRSAHPTHAPAGIGPLAPSILAGHDHTHPFGENSPIWKLWKLNTWVLLIGVEHSSNSTIHVGEEFNQLPYLPRIRTQKILQPNSTSQEITLRRPGDSNGFVKLGPTLESMNVIRETQVGAARFRLMRSDDIIQAATQMLSRDPAALLCDDPSCHRCIEARQMIQQAAK